MRINVIVLIFTLASTQSVSNRKINQERYVKERAIYSKPHIRVGDIKSSVACSTLCSSDPDCCGYTKDSATTNCLLFNYQTSNSCQNTTHGGKQQLRYVKQLADCTELPPSKPSGVYRVYPSRQTAVLVYCEMVDNGGGWTVLQRRQDGSEDFYRNWDDYKTGFGDLENEFWLGNDIMHVITSQMQYKVRFDLEDFDGLTAYAEFKNFYVDDETVNYGLNISGYTGTAGNGAEFDYFAVGIIPFSTRDRDNDLASFSCADDRKKCGWWFRDCTNTNINGKYEPEVSDGATIHWWTWRKLECLSKTMMAIKPL